VGEVHRDAPLRPRDLVRRAAARLADAGVASPEHDAAELLAHVVGRARGELPLVDEIGAGQEASYDALVARRAAREPLQHLTGVAHFRRVELAVGPGVFVPRPETELLAGWAVEAARVVSRLVAGAPRTSTTVGPPVVVDLGTGSGAIARAIADEVPGARVFAVELDPSAHAWAERNLAGTGVELRQGDLATAFEDLVGRVDVVACNPPYIPLEAWESVAVEARDHDPHLALFSGQDGLDAIRVLERRAAALLRPGGAVGVEHAEVQAEAVPEVFATAGRWSDVRDHRDLTGRARFTTAVLAR
jgi:release factor glutamine methyltransferase